MSSRNPGPGPAAPLATFPPAQRSSRALALAGCALLLCLVPRDASPAAAGRVEPPKSGIGPFRYRPNLVAPESLTPFLPEMKPGGNGSFPGEKEAQELYARLAELGARLKQGPDRAASVPEFLLGPGFKGGRLTPVEEVAAADEPSLQVFRARALPSDAVLDARDFARELRGLVEGFRTIGVAEFLITAIDARGDEATTDVRYDLVGPAREGGRAERVGGWRLGWRRLASGWRVVSWIATAELRSRAARPVFAEVTTAALGGNDSFRRQLAIGFDDWAAVIDSVLTRDTNAHNGVAVGDIDGDGLDDIYVCQPQGLPNRLLRAKGDGRFEDVTASAGVGILDDTSHALFADVDNDGDEDLVLTLGSGPVLFENDGTGRFTRVPDAFVYREQLQGAPMSMAIADYDRDGFLDLYLSVYSFYYGAGEGKGGTPVPYYDAQNGPPNVLFRNDGHGRFVEVTRETGLDAGNDRFSFSAAWGDYDGDGWPDLVVTNDFGRKNLYHNLGRRDGSVRFEDVSAAAGIEDYAAGMSVFWFDYDGDGRPDLYGGQMWSDSGLRVTASPAFMPDAPARVRELYHHHARGNSLFRNRGDGTFEDATLPARAEMGRWSWSTGALDFDSDGWEDLYVVNGMVTRASGPEDLDWFFWGGVVARSPLAAATGTPYDEAWRAINRALVHRSIASHHRHVLLRNDGQGGFDDVSGALGLDLDRDGRAFAVFDYDRDGDPDLLVMGSRAAPQLRLFRNDYAERRATLAVRLQGMPGSPFPETGLASSRDAIGARVTVETDRMRRTKWVEAGSGFLSQHSKELLFGLGASQRVVRLSVDWPSGRRQLFDDVALGQRLRLDEGGELRPEPYGPIPPLPADAAAARPAPARPPGASWLYEPVPAHAFSLRDLRGEERSLAALRGRPALVLFWATAAPESERALRALAAGRDALARTGVGALAIALDGPDGAERVRAAASGAGSVPVVVASDELALSYAILHRHLFLGEPDLPVPAALLLDAGGQVVKAYRDEVDVAAILRDAEAIDAAPAERLARALPFEGTPLATPGARNFMAYGRELLDQGLEAAALTAFERAAEGKPSSSTLYRLGTLLVRSGQPARARTMFERALELQPNLSEASNDLGTLLAEGGDVPAAIERFRAALAATPDYPDALNNLGYALLLTGRPSEARVLYEKALGLQPDFPEALNNLGLILGRDGELERAETYFRKALLARSGYGEAANNLALVLVARGQADEAVRLLQAFLDKNPASESTYITLARVYLAADHPQQALATVERLLRRNPGHALALELQKQLRTR